MHGSIYRKSRRSAGAATVVSLIAAASNGLANRVVAAERADASLERDWGLAPIRTWGSVAYDLRLEDVQDQPQRFQQLITTRFNLSSYFWEPWFAVTNGALGVTFSDLRDSDAEGRDHFLTGNWRLNLFPRSRFPFELHFDASDSRIDSGLGIAQDYRSSQYGFVQRYRPLNSSAQFMASFDHRNQDSSLTGEDAQDTLQFEFSQAFRHHNISLSTSLNDNERVDAGESTEYHTMVARHNYAPSSTLSIDTVANWVQTTRDLFTSDQESRYLQLSSIAFWRDPRRPLTVTASARLFDLESGRGDELTTESQHMGLNIGATYLLGPHWRLTAGTNLARGATRDADSLTVSENLGANYQSATRNFGRFEYDWYGGADVSATQSDDPAESSSDVVTVAQLGHALTRMRSLGARGALALNLGQRVTLQEGFDGTAQFSADRQLIHTASVTWNRSNGRDATFLRLAATDMRSLDGAAAELQLLNLQATRTGSASEMSSWSGSLTVQSTRQTSNIASNASRASGFVTTVGADLTYQRNRLWNVRQLSFFSQLRVSQEQLVQQFPDPRDRESHSWENRLEYAVGRLITRASVRAARIDEQFRVLATVKVVREIGN